MWQLNASVLIAQAESESPDLMSDTGQDGHQTCWLHFNILF